MKRKPLFLTVALGALYHSTAFAVFTETVKAGDVIDGEYVFDDPSMKINVQTVYGTANNTIIGSDGVQ